MTKSLYPFCTISADTLDSKDIAASLLQYIPESYPFMPIRGDLESIVDSGNSDLADIDTAISDLSDYYSELEMEPFTYIGMNPNDGAELMVLVDLESAQDDSDVLKVNDGGEIPAEYEGLALIVNDHGNATLVRSIGPDENDSDYAETVELWAMV